MADRVDTDTPFSPGWYLRVLMERLHNRRVGRDGRRRWSRTSLTSSRLRPPLMLLDDYWRGDPPLQEDIHRGWGDPFRQYYRMGRLHVADLLVSATSNRMGIRDFRTAAADDELGDVAARDLMRANRLKLVARDVHDTMLGLGDGYTMLTPPDAERDYTLITAESPLYTITAHGASGRTLAGLKMVRDDWDTADLAFLFIRDQGLYVARLEGPTTLKSNRPFSFSTKWTWDVDMFDDVPGGLVPIVRFRNRRGVGEFEHHLDTLDRINDKLFNEWWISKLQAFRQRALIIADEDQDDDYENDSEDYAPETSVTPEEARGLVETADRLFDKYARGELDGIFSSSPDALWTLPAGAKLWESATANFEPLMTSVKRELVHLAAVTSNPLHTMAPDAAGGSAEGASLLREEHVYKVEDRRDRADGAWAETIAMAFLFQGDSERADVRQIQTIWGPVERYSITEKASAASSLKGTLPQEAIWTDVLQYEPADVTERLRDLRARDLLFDPATGGTQQQGS